MTSSFEADIFEDHARQAAFLWAFRDRAARDAAYDLGDLCELDERLEAHLDGLRIAGDAGWEACVSLLARPKGGEVFGAAVLAVERWDLQGIARVLNTFGGTPDLGRGFVAALGWTPFDRVRRLLPGLLAGRCPPVLQWIGIAACAAHRRDPGAPLGYALLSGHPLLEARALRAAGELGRVDLLHDIRAELSSPNIACRFWSAWSAALFGDPASSSILFDFATGDSTFAERAACLSVRRMPPAMAYSWLHALEAAAGDPRVPVSAMAALGDPALVPHLLDAMSAPQTARLAASALSMITGLDLAAEHLAARPPEGFRSGPTDDPADDDVSMDPDDSLPWPDVAGVRDWWRRREGAFRRGDRYLLGQPMTPDWLSRVLLSGSQPARAAAALEISLRRPGHPVFEVRAPGFVQRRLLG